MRQINIAYYNSPFGEMILGSYDDRLCMADWKHRKGRETIDKRVQKALKASFVEKEDCVLMQAKEELEDYFKGQRQSFDIPLLLLGTALQKKVWQELMQIPYGDTVSYKEVAQKTGYEKALRAVASAVGANAISLFVPCHRVIGSNGSLTGYAGGLEAKKSLLEIENNLFSV